MSTETKKPVYKFVEEEGVEDITPIRRKIAKTMEVTENFNYYDTLAYVAKMEKAVKEKEAEIEGLNSMIKAYKEEIELIEQELGIVELEEKWNLDLHEKLKAEEAAKLAAESEVVAEEVATETEE